MADQSALEELRAAIQQLEDERRRLYRSWGRMSVFPKSYGVIDAFIDAHYRALSRASALIAGCDAVQERQALQVEHERLISLLATEVIAPYISHLRKEAGLAVAILYSRY